MSQKSKTTAAEVKQVLTELLLNAYSHIKAVNNEIHALGIKDPQEASADDQNKLRAMTLTLTLINDIIHPAHEISKKILNKSEHPIIDYCIKAQKVAFESKLVDECNCTSCKNNKQVKNDA